MTVTPPGPTVRWSMFAPACPGIRRSWRILTPWGPSSLASRSPVRTSPRAPCFQAVVLWGSLITLAIRTPGPPSLSRACCSRARRRRSYSRSALAPACPSTTRTPRSQSMQAKAWEAPSHTASSPMASSRPHAAHIPGRRIRSRWFGSVVAIEPESRSRRRSASRMDESTSSRDWRIATGGAGTSPVGALPRGFGTHRRNKTYASMIGPHLGRIHGPLTVRSNHRPDASCVAEAIVGRQRRRSNDGSDSAPRWVRFASGRKRCRIYWRVAGDATKPSRLRSGPASSRKPRSARSTRPRWRCRRLMSMRSTAAESSHPTSSV